MSKPLSQTAAFSNVEDMLLSDVIVSEFFIDNFLKLMSKILID